jgi:predicted nucleic acid-binding protein
VPKHRRALLDTSVVIDLERIDPAMLPEEPLISAITMAELAAGPAATADPTERARRQDRLQRAEASFAPLPFDDGAARAYGRIYAEVAAAGRKPRGPRALDLLIASIALDTGLPLYTRNPSDVAALSELIQIVEV